MLKRALMMRASQWSEADAKRVRAIVEKAAVEDQRDLTSSLHHRAVRSTRTRSVYSSSPSRRS
jgi:hypothetical protein